jgi:hypothetical protein
MSSDRNLGTQMLRTLFAAWLAFAAPSLARADDVGALELAAAPPEPAGEAGAAASPVAASDGFNAPTLAGPWRTRLALHGWLPNVLEVGVHTASKSGSIRKDLGWLVGKLDWVLPIDVEVRKGSFGAYVHTLAFGFDGDLDFGHAQIDWKDEGFLMDLGLSYELGRWALGEGPGAPLLTVEPFVGARLLYDPVDLAVDLGPLGTSTTDDFSNYVPAIGLRIFLDLTEHWNLRLEGDYGGFGVSDNHQTWQAIGLIGYRWPGWGVHWNLQAGYRAMRIFELRRNGYDVTLDARGADVVLAVEF